jgi:hypothetical protein
MDTSQTTGLGLTARTFPFRGTATNLDAPSAAALTRLYTARHLASPYQVARQGHTVTWDFDLVHSIADTRQGDPAMADADRDGEPPVCTADGFVRTDR